MCTNHTPSCVQTIHRNVYKLYTLMCTNHTPWYVRWNCMWCKKKATLTDASWTSVKILAPKKFVKFDLRVCKSYVDGFVCRELQRHTWSVSSWTTLLCNFLSGNTCKYWSRFFFCSLAHGVSVVLENTRIMLCAVLVNVQPSRTFFTIEFIGNQSWNESIVQQIRLLNFWICFTVYVVVVLCMVCVGVFELGVCCLICWNAYRNVSTVNLSLLKGNQLLV